MVLRFKELNEQQIILREAILLILIKKKISPQKCLIFLKKPQ